MARGWESKAVADQIEEGKTAREESKRKADLTPAQRAREARLASLLLSRSRLLEQLDRARLPAHRNVLMAGLSAIETEIEGLKTSSDT
jgi:hypothetical protein